MKRVVTLDSLRGIAAMVVVLHHCSLALPGLRESLEATYVLRPFIAGPEAVYVFFVLSGFALFMPLDQSDSPDLVVFLLKRLARLYPPLIAAILISAMLYQLIGPHKVVGMSDWFIRQSWTEPPSLHLIVGHVLLLNSFAFHNLDNPIWSLAHELRVSALIPLVVFAVRRRWMEAMLATFILSMGTQLIHQPNWLSVTLNPNGTAEILFLFVAGAALAAHRQPIGSWAQSTQGKAAGPGLLIGGLILISATPGLTPTYPTALGAIVLVGIAALSPIAEKCLTRPVLLWLGRLSFSLYLIHLPVLLTLTYGLQGIVPTWIPLLLTPPISLMAAELFHRMFERPSIQLSRIVGQRGRYPELARQRIKAETQNI